MRSAGMNCCGWDEVYDLRFWDGSEDEFISAMLDGHLSFVDGYDGTCMCGAIIFTYNGKPSKIGDYGKKFAQLIVKRELGSILKLPIFINPNHNSKITSYIWTLNKREVTAYVKRHRKIRDKEDGINDYY